MGFLTTYTKNLALGALESPLYAALHSADPGVDGSGNELSGGNPAYARVPVALAAASGGVRALAAGVTVNVPAGATVAYASLWTSPTGGECVAVDDVTPETFAAQGQYDLTAFPLAIGDPA